MKTQLTKRSLIALALIAMLASSAGASVLHDQSSYGAWGAGFLNAVAGGPPFGGTSYSVNDVTVGGVGWTIESISIIVNALGDYPANTTTAYVNIFPKTGPMPTATDVPDISMPVAVTVTNVFDLDWMVTASGLSIELEPGEYWIGLTPAASDLYAGIHIPSDILVGDATPSYDPNGFPVPMWSQWVPDTDATILIEGDDQTVATESVSMGSVKALFR